MITYTQFAVAEGAGWAEPAGSSTRVIHLPHMNALEHQLWEQQVTDWLMFNQTGSDICVLTLTRVS